MDRMGRWSLQFLLLLSLSPAQDPLESAADKLQAKDYRGALDAFAKAVDADPQSPRAWDGRARAKHGLGDAAGARADFKKAVDLDPKNAESLLHRAIFNLETKDVSAAFADLSRSYAINPSAAAAYQFGLAWKAKGFPKEAVQNLDK